MESDKYTMDKLYAKLVLFTRSFIFPVLKHKGVEHVTLGRLFTEVAVEVS
jgi:hypothetical protein